MRPKRYIFVGGAHRSGTSLIERLIKAHRDVSGFENTGVPEDEGQHLQDVLPKNVPAGAFGRSKEAHLDESHLACTPATREKLLEQWGRYWDVSKDVLIEKTPQNIVKTRFLQGLFPEAAFVMVVRHPIAVAYATRTRRWTRKASIETLIANTLGCYERLIEDLPALRRCYVLRYEQFVEDPQRSLQDVLNFLDLSPCDPVEKVRADVNRRYFNLWSRSRLGAVWPSLRTRRWLHAPKRELIGKYEQRVNAIGYSLRDPPRLIEHRFFGPHHNAD